MTIPFEQIPTDNMVPFFFVEFSDSAGDDSLAVMPWTVLLIGQKTDAGTADPLTLYEITADGQGEDLGGDGSVAARQIDAYRSITGRKRMKAIFVEDDATAVQRVVTITYAGAAAGSGSEAVYVGSRGAEVGTANLDTPADIVTDLVAKLNAVKNFPAVATADTVNLVLTFKNGGALANEMIVSTNYRGDKGTPGITKSIVNTTAGSVDPDLSVQDVVSVMGDDQFLAIANPYGSTANLTVIQNELADRWGPIRQIGGVQFCAKNDTFANVQSWGNAMNSPFTAPVSAVKYQSPPEEVAAEMVGIVANAASIDPARPFQTLAFVDALPPLKADRTNFDEDNILLQSGISTLAVSDSSNQVSIQRVVSSYKTSATGAPSKTYRNVNALYTWEAIRYDIRTYMKAKYPRHKLGKEGGNYGDGQPIMTREIFKAEIISRAVEWEKNGWIEGLPAFIEALTVERSDIDDDRLDARLKPDLINQFRIAGVQIQNLL